MQIAVTGANAGIGLRATSLLVAQGHRLIALCRDVDRAHAAFGSVPAEHRERITIMELDLASAASIRTAADQVVAAGPLDALINNAAIFDQSTRTARFSADGHELFWATNHLGPTQLTALVSPALAAAQNPRVMFVASKGLMTMPRIAIRFERLDDPSWFTPTAAYYHAKLAQVMIAITLAERAGDQLDVSCLRVPAVRLDADRLAAQPALLRALYAPKNRLAASPEQIAQVYAELITGPARHARGSGVYRDENLRETAVPRFARDAAHRDRLWDLTAATIGHPTWAWPRADAGDQR